MNKPLSAQTGVSIKKTLESQEERPKSVGNHLKSSLSQDDANAQHTDNIQSVTTTTILTESSTVPSPLRSPSAISNSEMLLPKYKTMPSPTHTKVSTKSNSPPQLTLNEILEDGDAVLTVTTNLSDGSNSAKSRVVRRTGYEQRRSKFHKTRTASCSSSDASDDDSESRKKRAHKLSGSGKPFPPRRDSHDDSSDSQDPGGSGGGGGGGGGLGNSERTHETSSSEPTGNDNGGDRNKTTSSTSTTTNTDGTHRCSENQTVVFSRKHRAGRRRSGETRLRESQSLNRITEVQEAEGPTYHTHNHSHTLRSAVFTQSVVLSPPRIEMTTQTTPQTVTTVKRAKGFGARLLQSWSLGNSKSSSSPLTEKTRGLGKFII